MRNIINRFLFQQCITKLDVETFEHGIVLEILYAIGFALIGAIINCVGKLIILSKICCEFLRISFSQLFVFSSHLQPQFYSDAESLVSPQFSFKFLRLVYTCLSYSSVLAWASQF